MNFWFNRLCWSLSIALFVVATSILAHNDHHAVSIFHHAPRIDAPQQQSSIKQQHTHWKEFTQKHGKWHITFNTLTQLPLRAAGKPIALPAGKDVVEQAKQFIQTELAHLGIPVDQLVLHKVNQSSKYTFVHFIQKHKGKTILNSKLQIRINQNNQVVGFTADVFNDIDVNLSTPLSKGDLAQAATSDLHGDDWEIDFSTETQILPIPTTKGYTFALVYEGQVKSDTHGKAPADYYSIIDAHTGELYYRHNKVWTIEVEDLPVTADVVNNPNQPSTPILLPNMRVVIEGKEYKTDDAGILTYDGEFPAEGTVYLEGDFARVFNREVGSSVPNYPVIVEEAGKAVQLAPNINESELAGFYHTNIIHSHMKQWLPAEFTDLDFPMPVNINLTDDQCNAYYDGSSINFFAETGQCHSSVLFADVVYHEYGHGINDFYYDYLGSVMDNGALHEGYADVWSLSLTQSPVLSQGGLRKDSASFVRRYDQNTKSYPENLIGQVHNDGEIIAGAWWDLGQLIGMDNMMAIFAESLVPASMRPSGQEGPLYGDILFDALFASDDDGDLSNGTPYIDEVFESFDNHGITVLIGVDIVHEDLITMPINAPIQIPFDLRADFDYIDLLDQARVYFRTDPSQSFEHFTTAVDFANDSFMAIIPAQPAGTVIEYYIEIRDTLGGIPSTLPTGVTDVGGNPPYQVIVGLTPKMEDHLVTGNGWQIGAPDDDASTGIWQIGSPNPTFSGNGSFIQPGSDHTLTNDNFCAFTGNGNNPQSIGQNDVDDGKTTLFSPVFDLTPYEIPVFSYYRWYSNNAGANPEIDFWVVDITNNGVDWVTVENTNKTDASWREVVVKVSDYVTPTTTVQFRFIASDPLRPNLDLDFDGGSLVEAAVDDLTLYDLPDAVGFGSPIANTLPIEVYPNPATDFMMIVGGSNIQQAQISLFNVVGQRVYQQNGVNLSQSNFTVATSDLAAGIYVLKVEQGGAVYQEKIVIQ